MQCRRQLGGDETGEATLRVAVWWGSVEDNVKMHVSFLFSPENGKSRRAAVIFNVRRGFGSLDGSFQSSALFLVVFSQWLVINMGTTLRDEQSKIKVNGNLVLAHLEPLAEHFSLTHQSLSTCTVRSHLFAPLLNRNQNNILTMYMNRVPSDKEKGRKALPTARLIKFS